LTGINLIIDFTMFERMGNQQEDELFLTPGQIEIDALIRKEKRKDDQAKLILKIGKLLGERGIDDFEFIQEFSEWQKIERDIIGEIEDSNAYNEEQVRLLIREAKIFADAGLKYNKADLINQALDRLAGTEDEGYYDGVLYDAKQKADAGIVEKKIAVEIESKILELRRILEEG